MYTITVISIAFHLKYRYFFNAEEYASVNEIVIATKLGDDDYTAVKSKKLLFRNISKTKKK